MLSVRLLIRSVSHNLFESSWTLDYFVFFFVRCPTGAYTTGCCCWWWWWSLPNIQPNVSCSITANYSFRWAQLFTMSQPYIPLSQIFWSWTTRKQRERDKKKTPTKLYIHYGACNFRLLRQLVRLFKLRICEMQWRVHFFFTSVISDFEMDFKVFETFSLNYSHLLGTFPFSWSSSGSQASICSPYLSFKWVITE